MPAERVHELRTWPGQFQAVLDGLKPFEWRKDDRGYEVGDVLVLREWDPKIVQERQGAGSYSMAENYAYTGRRIRARVTYILRGRFGVPDGYVVMGLSEVVWLP